MALEPWKRELGATMEVPGRTVGLELRQVLGQVPGLEQERRAPYLNPEAWAGRPSSPIRRLASARRANQLRHLLGPLKGKM